MSEIENAAMPILLTLMRGEPISLDRHQQIALAMWLTVKTMVYDNQPHVLHAVPAEDRDFIYANRERAGWRLPENWRLWVGRTDTPFGTCAAVASHRLIVDELPDGSLWPNPTEPGAFSMCFGLLSGQFLAFVVRSPFVSRGLRFADEGTIMRRVWQARDRVEWPPPETVPFGDVAGVTRQTVDLIADAVGRR